MRYLYCNRYLECKASSLEKSSCFAPIDFFTDREEIYYPTGCGVGKLKPVTIRYISNFEVKMIKAILKEEL